MHCTGFQEICCKQKASDWYASFKFRRLLQSLSSEFLADDNYLNEGKTLVSTKALKIEITNAKKLLYCFFVTTFLNSFLVYLGDLFNYSCFIPLLSKLWSFFLFYKILTFQLHVTWIHMLIKYSIVKVSIVWDFLLLLLLFLYRMLRFQLHVT